MKRLIDSLAKLKLDGTEEEKLEFDKFKYANLKDLEQLQIEILAQLKEHHERTFYHNVIVSRDVNYIAKQLGFSDDLVTSLTFAALFHDIGKLDIHEAIIDLSKNETYEIWKLKNKNKPFPKNGVSIYDITLRDVITYNSSISDNPKEYEKKFLKWVYKREVGRYLDRSVREYLNHHQKGTMQILTKLGVDPKIVEYASSHHLNYFENYDAEKKPEECKIIEIADKFNAIAQTEGVRNYIKKVSRAEALATVLTELKKEESKKKIGNIFKNNKFENNIMKIIAKKYVPSDLMRLSIRIKKIIDLYEKKQNLSSLKASKKIFEDGIIMLKEVIAYIVLETEFRDIETPDEYRMVLFYKEVLEKVLHVTLS